MGGEDEGGEPAVGCVSKTCVLGYDVVDLQVGEDEVQGDVVVPVGLREGEDQGRDPEDEGEGGLWYVS